MARQSFNDIPLGSYPNGARVSAWRAIPDGATYLFVQVAICTPSTPTIWPNASTTLNLGLQVSLDGSTIAYRQTTGPIPGGQHAGPKPNANVLGIEFQLPAGVGRFGRIGAVIAGGPLITSVNIGYE